MSKRFFKQNTKGILQKIHANSGFRGSGLKQSTKRNTCTNI